MDKIYNEEGMHFYKSSKKKTLRLSNKQKKLAD